jgi:ubiquinone/menaquinone biosynthesis C-methylase UbiE
MPERQDVQAFDDRADGYEQGRIGRWHQRVAMRAADAALAFAPLALRVLDVGCGTGLMLRELSYRLPNAIELVGLDPAPRMLAEARTADEGSAMFVRGIAENLPLPDDHFDLVVSCLSFDHWADQGKGLAEAARVVAPTGVIVIIDLCARWMRAYERARKPAAIRALAEAAGLVVDDHEIVSRLVGLPYVRASKLIR